MNAAKRVAVIRVWEHSLQNPARSSVELRRRCGDEGFREAGFDTSLSFLQYEYEWSEFLVDDQGHKTAAVIDLRNMPMCGKIFMIPTRAERRMSRVSLCECEAALDSFRETPVAEYAVTFSDRPQRIGASAEALGSSGLFPKIEALACYPPSGCKKLKGAQTSGDRVGDYRRSLIHGRLATGVDIIAVRHPKLSLPRLRTRASTASALAAHGYNRPNLRYRSGARTDGTSRPGLADER